MAPALTPVRWTDLVAGLVGYLTQDGRETFIGKITDRFGGCSVGTYTSYRRALGACLREVAEAGLKGRTDVFIPAFCSRDYPKAIEGVGLETRRYDVAPETLAVDRTSIDHAALEDALALIVVNVLGYASEMNEIRELADETDTYLLEALGYSIGTTYRGSALGTFGDCVLLNFQQGKPIPVGGGMAVSRDPSIVFTDIGRAPAGPNAGVLTGYALFASPMHYFLYSQLADWTEYMDVGFGRVTTHPGSKEQVDYAERFGTMSNFQCRVAGRILERLDVYRDHRADVANYYTRAFSRSGELDVPSPIAGTASHQFVRFPVLVHSTGLREQIQGLLLDSGIHSTTLYDWPSIDPDEFPGAARLQREILTLPTHPYVDSRDRRLVVETVLNAMKEYTDVAG